MKTNDKDINDNDELLETIAYYINLYIEDKKVGNLSKNTITNATRILERFYDYLADEVAENDYLTISDINKYFLSNYLNHLNQKGLGKSTQKLHLIVIKGLFCYIAGFDMDKYGFLKTNVNGLKIKVAQKEKNGLSQAEQKLLLNYISQLENKKTYLVQRDSLLIKLLLYTGIRASELINIKWTDINEYEDETTGLIYTILIQGKGNKERYTYLAYDKGVKHIEYLKHNTNISDYLFTSTHGNKCNTRTILSVVNNILKASTVDKTGLHIFRHTFARNLVNENINLSTIKDLLGHSNIAVTAQFYAKTNEQNKRSALMNMKTI